jgi:hypothetical protein
VIPRYILDFEKTIDEAVLRAVDPKMQRVDKNNPESALVQARDGAGVPKWQVTLSVRTEVYGNAKYEDIPITVTSPTKPCTAIPPMAPVTISGLEMGIMARDKGGYTVFFSASAEAIRPVQPARPVSAEAMRPLPPARPASGQ